MNRSAHLKLNRRSLVALAGGAALIAGTVSASAAADVAAGQHRSAAAAVPEECRGTQDTNNGTPVRTAFPHDATTGPEVGGYDEDNLTPSGVTGQWVINQDGTVIDGVYHNGFIDVRADNVTIRNSVVCGIAHHLVRNSGQNLTIENSIVRGQRGGEGEPCLSAVSWGNYTLTKSEIAYCADLIKVSAVTEVTDSWFHDQWANRQPGNPGLHPDTAQKNKDLDLVELTFTGNAAYGDSCVGHRHFQIQDATDDVVEINGNFFYGLQGVINVGGSISGHINNNTLAGSATEGPFTDFDSGHMHPGLWRGNHGAISKSGNAFESGEPVPANGIADPYICVAG